MGTDGKTTTQDPLQTGPASDGQGNPSDQGKTYTQAEVDAIINQRHSKLDTQIFTLTEQNKTLTSELSGLKTAEETRQAKEREERLKAAGNDPDLRRLILKEEELAKQEKAIAEKERSINQRLQENDEFLKEANEVKRLQVIQTIAKEEGVDPEVLKEFPGNTPDEIRATAKKLTKINVGPRNPIPPFGKPGAPGAKTALEIAQEELAEAKSRGKTG
jgi:hypothetical protein